VKAVAPEAGLPLLGAAGGPVSEPVSLRDWCRAALQGSVSITGTDGAVRHYAFMDSDGPEQADCDAFLGDLPEGVKRASRRARYREMRDETGCGLRSLPLMPFRTIASDPRRLPSGSVVFAPALRGRSFALRGRTFVHDGYLFAGDTGGAVRGGQIDIFTDGGEGDPLPGFIGHTPQARFSAFRVEPGAPAAQAIYEKLRVICPGAELDR